MLCNFLLRFCNHFLSYYVACLSPCRRDKNLDYCQVSTDFLCQLDTLHTGIAIYFYITFR